MELLQDLSPVQRDAVTHIEGPLLMLAGAGSGKTRVLTYRVAYLIKEKGVNPQSILAITFTNKAAEEMKERIEQLIGEISERMWIGTFHATCAKILRKEAHRLGYKRNFVIYDQGDSNRLVSACLKDLNLDTKRFPPTSMASAISAAKNELIDAETFASRAQTYLDKVIADVYHLYQQKIYQSNAMDFDDLIMFVVNLFQLFPNVLKAYQEKFKYILIDEYQDTNHAQYVFVNLLAGGYRNLAVVGDPDQSIYQFRGADIRNILEFENDYPDAKVITLDQNYRSTQVILEAANYVIQNNRGRKPKSLWTTNAPGEAITRYQAENEHDEAAFVATEIERLREIEERKYGNFAIFYRTNAQSRVFEDVFMRFGLPYKIVGGLRFYERAEIKDILAYLRAISNPEDAVSLKRIINVPKRGIGKTTLENVEKLAAKENIGFYEALKRADTPPLAGWLTDRAKKGIGNFLSMLDELGELVGKRSLFDFIQSVLERTGYVAALEEERTVEAMGKVENVKELLSVAREFETNLPDATLGDFLEHISLLTDIDLYEEEAEAVTLMTLHNAKGLEFPVVFVAGMEDGIFPHIRSLTDLSELEEERRLCYVGITRAKERLYLTHAWSRSLWGGTSYQMQSRFLREIPEVLIQPVEEVEVKIPTPQQVEVTFAVGDEVMHKKFGRGKVVAVKGSDQVTVLFPTEGEKTLLVSYAPLEKVQ
ncbi:MAG: DNA helicase PcrA [Actinomycetota bacterium]|nr:DNA helicase PcrA [Actinomycetota bacterium]